jgi:hypothetical protein
LVLAALRPLVIPERNFGVLPTHVADRMLSSLSEKDHPASLLLTVLPKLVPIHHPVPQKKRAGPLDCETR